MGGVDLKIRYDKDFENSVNHSKSGTHESCLTLLHDPGMRQILLSPFKDVE